MIRGKLIVIDGIDASGKKTQTKLLIDRLNCEGIVAKAISFPRYETPTGRVIGQCYLGKKGLGEGDVAWFGDPNKLDPRISSLYYAADRLYVASELNEMLKNGITSILDRYYQANMAHQGGKKDSAPKRKAFYEFIRLLELEVLKIPKEDLAIFLHMPTEVAIELMKRDGKEKDLHEGDIEHLKRAEQAYLEIIRNYFYEWKIIPCAPDRNINSLRTPLDIAEEVYSHVIKVIRG